MNKRLLCAVAVVPLLVSCGDDPERPPPRGGADPIVVVEWHTGLGPPAAAWALPVYVLLGDGTAIVGGEDQGIVLSATRRTLSAEQISELYARAGAADLFRSHTYPSDALDASALVVRITSDRGSYETTVIQPDSRDGGDRGRVVKFADKAPETGQAAGAYVPDRVAAIVVADGENTADVRPWPLAVPPDEMPGYSSRPCLIVSGAQVRPLLDTARTATAETRWSAGERALSLRIRPLLPFEHDCGDLRRG